MTQTSTPTTVTFQGAWSASDNQVFLVSDKRGNIAGPSGDPLPATSREAAVQALRARGYRTVDGWYTYGTDTYWINLKRVAA